MNALDLLYIPLAAVTAPLWAPIGRNKKRTGWSERMGKVAPLFEKKRPRIMLHAVSVGEVNALRALVPLLLPEADVLVTTTTDTGLARARELFESTPDHRLSVRRYPLDFSWSVNRFLNTTKPDVIALVELEVWPNFVSLATSRKIPVCVINGRLSERSFKGYNRIRSFISGTLNKLEFAAVQDADYAARFEALGLPPNKCLLTGSMKWDAVTTSTSVPGADQLAAELGIDLTRPLIVAGSTGPGEEALLHAATPPGVQLLCAPRKPERFEEAAAALPNCTRRSKPSTTPNTSDRFLLDTIGELRKAYSLATLAVVGRSFTGTLFGSDPIEPIALAKPTIIGPDVQDFAAIVSLLESNPSGPAIARATRESLKQVISDLLNNPTQRQALAQSGLAVIAAQKGASQRHAEVLLSLALDEQTPAKNPDRPR